MGWKGDSDAVHTVVDGEFNGLTEKSSPVDDDLVLIEDSANSFAKRAAKLGNLPGGGGGGGGNTPEWIEYLNARQADETSHADDDFFTDADHTNWTETTISGNATWTELRDLLSVKFDSQTAGDVTAMLLPLSSPSAPLTVETAISGHMAISNFYSVGVGFADGTTATDNIATVRRLVDERFFQSAGTLTNYTGTVNNSIPDYRLTGGLLYMRVVWTTTNTFATQFSADGVSWITAGSSFSFTMTPTHAVLFGSAQDGGSDGASIGFHYLRRNNSDPT